MSRENVVQRFAVFVGLLSCIHSLPHDICFEQFDARDCKQPAKQVFYFYKPGSRCEIATWRGCPTRNKFDNEFECSHRCVGKLWTGSGEVQDKEREIIIIDTCKETLNTTDCGKHQEVYTFDDGICLKNVWKGCDTHNKFGDEAACTKACVSENDWKLELNALEIADVEEIDKLLHHVLEKERKLMKLLYYQEEIKPETTALEGESEPANVTEPELESEEKPKTEAEPEAAAKPEVDTEPEAEAEPESEAEPEAEAEAEPEVEAEPGAEAEPEAQTEVLPATETTPETTAESESEEGTWTNRPEVVGSLEEVITT